MSADIRYRVRRGEQFLCYCKYEDRFWLGDVDDAFALRFDEKLAAASFSKPGLGDRVVQEVDGAVSTDSECPLKIRGLKPVTLKRGEG